MSEFQPGSGFSAHANCRGGGVPHRVLHQRGENALDEYGSIKAHGRAIYFAARDWLEDPGSETLDGAGALLGDLLKACRTLFFESLDPMPANEKSVYRVFSKLSEFKNDLRKAGLASGKHSRCNQYLSEKVVAFESIKHIYQHRTPRTLRSFSDVFITVPPLLYGLYYVHIAQDYGYGLGYNMPILFTLILVSLDNIQEQLEIPFHQVGEDDLSINAEKFALSMQSESSSAGGANKAFGF